MRTILYINRANVTLENLRDIAIEAGFIAFIDESDECQIEVEDRVNWICSNLPIDDIYNESLINSLESIKPQSLIFIEFGGSTINKLRELLSRVVRQYDGLVTVGDMWPEHYTSDNIEDLELPK